MKILKVSTKRREIGNAGEKAAAKFLKKQGYRILEKNYVSCGYEIDLIAQNREYTVFCEVKTRTLGHENPKESRPASAVTPEKQRKIISVAKFYLSNKNSSRNIRFDIIEVFVNEEKAVKKLNHLEAAFNLDTAYAH